MDRSQGHAERLGNFASRESAEIRQLEHAALLVGESPEGLLDDRSQDGLPGCFRHICLRINGFHLGLAFQSMRPAAGPAEVIDRLVGFSEEEIKSLGEKIAKEKKRRDKKPAIEK